MNILLDTHTFLWFINASPQLPVVALNLIEYEAEGVYLSYVSFWEMAIKTSLGKLTLPKPLLPFIQSQLDINHITWLDIRPEQIDYLVDLPFHHKDPFDRLLIAQSLVEDIPLVSQEALFDVYGVKRYWNNPTF